MRKRFSLFWNSKKIEEKKTKNKQKGEKEKGKEERKRERNRGREREREEERERKMGDVEMRVTDPSNQLSVVDVDNPRRNSKRLRFLFFLFFLFFFPLCSNFFSNFDPFLPLSFLFSFASPPPSLSFFLLFSQVSTGEYFTEDPEGLEKSRKAAQKKYEVAFLLLCYF